MGTRDLTSDDVKIELVVFCDEAAIVDLNGSVAVSDTEYCRSIEKTKDLALDIESAEVTRKVGWQVGGPHCIWIKGRRGHGGNRDPHSIRHYSKPLSIYLGCRVGTRLDQH